MKRENNRFSVLICKESEQRKQMGKTQFRIAVTCNRQKESLMDDIT